MLNLGAARPPARLDRACRPGGPWTVSTPSLGVQVSMAGDTLVVAYATDGALGPAAQALFLPVQWNDAGRCRVVAAAQPADAQAAEGFDALYRRISHYPGPAALHGAHLAAGPGRWLRAAAGGAQGSWGVRASFDHAGGQQAYEIQLRG